jgi:hypothetical protein
MQPIPHHEKDSATRERILSVLQREVTFSHLRLDQLQEAIDAMRDRKLPAGEIIIKEGELGDEVCCSTMILPSYLLACLTSSFSIRGVIRCS